MDFGGSRGLTGKQGTGNREQRTENREQRTGNRGTGNREQGTGNREQRTGNREQGTGVSCQGTVVRNDPGLKPISSRGWIQGPEGPCSLRRTWAKAEKRQRQEQKQIPYGNDKTRTGNGAIRRFWLRQNDEQKRATASFAAANDNPP
jgi:hypothetical protein